MLQCASAVPMLRARAEKDANDDVPLNFEVLDPLPEDRPSAAAFLFPDVKRVDNTFSWELPNFNSRSIEPFGVISDSWGGNPPNMNRAFVRDPVNSTEMALSVKYPANTSTPTSLMNPPGGIRGGTGFYAQPISQFVMPYAKEVTFEYKVYIPVGFDFVRGGKLPGLYASGGAFKGCSGGSDALDCFSIRYMFRKGGDAEAYIYTPHTAVQAPEYCQLPPYSYCKEGSGDSIARGAVRFVPGTWTTLKMTLRMNTVGKQNGRLLWVGNGQVLVDYKQMVWRVNSDVKFQGIIFQTFFGGSTPDAVTPVNQTILFKGFKMQVTV